MGDGSFRAVDVFENAGIDEPPDQQIGISKPVQFDDGPDPVVLVSGEDDDLSLVCLLNGIFRNQVEGQRKA